MIDLSLLIDIGSKVIAAASAIAAVTPTAKDDAFLSRMQALILKAVNFLALNVMNAKVTAPTSNDLNK